MLRRNSEESVSFTYPRTLRKTASFRSNADTLYKVDRSLTLGGTHRFVPCGAAAAAEATAVGDELWGGLSSLINNIHIGTTMYSITSTDTDTDTHTQTHTHTHTPV